MVQRPVVQTRSLTLVMKIAVYTHSCNLHACKSRRLNGFKCVFLIKISWVRIRSVVIYFLFIVFFSHLSVLLYYYETFLLPKLEHVNKSSTSDGSLSLISIAVSKEPQAESFT
jgi:hypothetical protein